VVAFSTSVTASMSAAVLQSVLPSFIVEQDQILPKDCIKLGDTSINFMAQLLVDNCTPTIFTAETTDNTPAVSESGQLGESEPTAGYSMVQPSVESNSALDMTELAEALEALQPSLPEAAADDAPTGAGELHVEVPLAVEVSAETHCYLENCHQVMESLYLGGVEAAQDSQGLAQQGIHAVVCCMQWLEYPSSKFVSGLEYHRVDVEDKGIEPLELYLPEATEFIHTQIAQGRQVFVHCRAGVSRSASVMLAYLIEYRGYSLYDAFHLIRRIRPTITPNPGFMEQLIAYEKKMHGSSKPSIDFRKYVAWVQERADPEPDLTPD